MIMALVNSFKACHFNSVFKIRHLALSKRTALNIPTKNALNFAIRQAHIALNLNARILSIKTSA